MNSWFCNKGHMVCSSECRTGEAKLMGFTQTPVPISSLTSSLLHPRIHSCGNCRTHLSLSRALAELIIEHLIKWNSEWMYPEVRVHGKHKANPTSSTEFLWLNANLLSVLIGLGCTQTYFVHQSQTQFNKAENQQECHLEVRYYKHLLRDFNTIRLQILPWFGNKLIFWTPSYKAHKPKLNPASTGHHYQQKVTDQ